MKKTQIINEPSANQFETLNKSYINGVWTEGKSERTYNILNPYNDSVITSVRLATKDQLEVAFETAANAQKQWAKSTAEQRRAVLEKVGEYFKSNQEDIVDLISRETGGTVLKGMAEIFSSLDVLGEYIKCADDIFKVKEVLSGSDGKIHQVYRLPLGVISSVSPFNFSLYLSMRTIVPAIALGNSIVHKPDIQVGISGGVIIAKAFEYAGLPKGVFNMILTDIDEIGDEMLTNSNTKLISFTGSTAVGRHIGSIAGRNLKRVALELGGNSPFVVLSDANVEHAVSASIFGKFLHQGQVCMGINRIIVHKDKYEEFVDKFVAKAKMLPYGNPSNPKTVIGPIVNKQQIQKAVNFIELAKREGATLALEGKLEGNILTPYVFTNVNNSSSLAQSELFAPIALVIKAESDEHAIDLANDTEHGLSSAIFTSNLEKGKEYALQIDSGMTHINDQTINDGPNVPFGGNKASGLGRFGNPWIVEEFTVTKWVSIQTKNKGYPF